MKVESVWLLCGIIIGAIIFINFGIHIVLSVIAGTFVGFILTTVLKMLNWYKFKDSSYDTYSSADRSSSHDDWDD